MSSTHLSQMSQSNNTDEAVFRKFHLTPGSAVTIEGRQYNLERRLRDTWQFISHENEPNFKTDRQLASLMAAGAFHVDWQPGTRDDLPHPPDPLNIGPDAHAENLRKLEYVQGCLKSPRFSRYRPTLNAIIAAIAARRREAEPDEKTPSFNAVLGWIDRYTKYGNVYGPAALSGRHDRKGNRRTRLAPFQQEAIQLAIEKNIGARTIASAYATVHASIRELEDSGTLDKGAIDPRFLDENGRLRVPCLRTFERYCNEVNRFVQDGMKVGLNFARNRARTYATNPRPDRPYAEVEVDHCLLDITLIHSNGIPLGRPNVVTFKDRATGMIAGYSIAFRGPSYASFMQGLRNTIYPKDDMGRYPHVSHQWPCYGTIENLFHDNGKEFTGDDIRAACRSLNINLVPLAKRQPWLKGGLERFFRTLNWDLVHSCAGTTKSNAVARRDFEDLPAAALTLQAFDSLLRYWVCDIYNVSDSKGLGFIRGFGGESPLDAWNAKARDYASDALPHRHLFTALAGHVEYRTLQKAGFRVANIFYEGPVLSRLLTHPKHARATTGREATKYKVVIDPYNIGLAHVVNHHDNEIIDVPATAAHQEYTTNLTLAEHEIISARARENSGSSKHLRIEELMRAKAALNEYAQRITSQRKFKTVQRQYGRWMESQASRTQRFRSQMVAGEVATSPDYLGLDAPQGATPVQSPRHASYHPSPTAAGSPHPAGRHLPGAIGAVEDDDLDEMMNDKQWTSSHDYD